jgi:hypothetical protein
MKPPSTIRIAAALAGFLILSFRARRGGVGVRSKARALGLVEARRRRHIGAATVSGSSGLAGSRAGPFDIGSPRKKAAPIDWGEPTGAY